MLASDSYTLLSLSSKIFQQKSSSVSFLRIFKKPDIKGSREKLLMLLGNSCMAKKISTGVSDRCVFALASTRPSLRFSSILPVHVVLKFNLYWTVTRRLIFVVVLILRYLCKTRKINYTLDYIITNITVFT